MADLVFPGQGGTSLNSAALPASNDLVVYKGDYVEIFVTIKDSSGTAISLAGATPKAQLKSDYNDRNPKDFTCTQPGPTGQVRIYLPSSTTATLIPGSYIWDFQVTFAGGDTRTYLAGDVTVYNEVTT
jgi:hypothetical protein